MKEVPVKILTVDNVRRFVHLCKPFRENIEIVSGRRVVDAKSILGIFSIDLTQSLIARIDTDHEEVFDTFKNQIQEFIVE